MRRVCNRSTSPIEGNLTRCLQTRQLQQRYQALQPLIERLETEIKRYKRYGSEVSVLMIDIDDFKQFNDAHGHQEGDRILVEVALLIEKTTRDLDICCRYGGEEFSVILPQTDYKAALKIAGRIRGRIESKLKKGSGITVSIGCAMCPKDGKSTNVLVKKADKALYFSKATGKNQVTAYYDIN